MMAESGTFKQILCGVDFSEDSRHALEWAVAVAGGQGAEITILNVCPLAPLPVSDLPMPDELYRASDVDKAHARVAPFLEFVKRAGIAARAQIEIGHPAAVIAAHAKALQSDLVVIGTHGRSGFNRLVLGSVAEKVLRSVGCPALTVPPRAHSTATLPFKRILCPIDFSPWSFAAVTLAESMARASGASLTLLHVVEWPWEEPPAPSFDELPPVQAQALSDYRRERETQGLSRLQGLIPDATKTGVTVISRVLHGKAYERILAVATEEHSDLIVLGVHGRRTADLVLFGSTANQLVRKATCPVVTLRR